MKLLMAVLTLSMPMLQSEMCADTIKIVRAIHDGNIYSAKFIK